MENTSVCLQKNRTWTMFASAAVVLLLTLAFTPAHGFARWMGLGMACLCLVMATLAITVLAAPSAALPRHDELP